MIISASRRTDIPCYNSNSELLIGAVGMGEKILERKVRSHRQEKMKLF